MPKAGHQAQERGDRGDPEEPHAPGGLDLAPAHGAADAPVHSQMVTRGTLATIFHRPGIRCKNGTVSKSNSGA